MFPKRESYHGSVGPQGVQAYGSTMLEAQVGVCALAAEKWPEVIK